MGVLSVRHVTTYHYSEPVELGEHRMMFRPRESHDLRLIRTRLSITPQPADLHWRHDVFDNSVAVANFDCATTRLRFDSMVTLEHFETRRPDYALEVSARRFPFDYPRDEWPDLAPALHRSEPSEQVDQWAAKFVSCGLARPGSARQERSAAGTIGTIDLLRAMALGIREQLRYMRRVERGVQTPVETLRRGSGTCRDFAWLMIDAVRSLGFAARFVSGYIFVPDDAPQTSVAPTSTAAGNSIDAPLVIDQRRTVTAPFVIDEGAVIDEGGVIDGRGTIDEGGATHAWLQVYLPGAGWVDFDPTNSIIGNHNLIRVAVAWSPMQVLPLWGTYIGSANACLGMRVAVSVTEEPSHANTLA